MNKFEITMVFMTHGGFITKVVEGETVVDAMLTYFDGQDLRSEFEQSIKENYSGGWFMMNNEEQYIIRQI